MYKHVRVALGWALIGWLAAACSTSAVEPTETSLPNTANVRPSPTDAIARETPTQAPTATEACTETEGAMERTTYQSSLLGREVPIWFYVPPCFEPEQDANSLLILLHGKPFDESYWPSLGLVSVYERGLAQGRWGPTVMAFPRAPEPLFSSSDGGPGSYEAEFVDTVLPYTESRYAATGWTGTRGMAGISRGGIWVLQIGLRHPELFGKLAALSPSLAVNYPREEFDPFHLVQESQALPESILLLAGEQDWARRDTVRLHEALRERGAQANLEIVAGEHTDSTWANSLTLVLEYLLAGGSEP